MGKLIFVTGGCKSGKSKFAVSIAKKTKGKILFIATCIPKDKEMKERVKLHKLERPKNWDTIEEEKNVSDLIKKVKDKYSCIIIDCLTILISNFLLEGKNKKYIEKEVEKIARISRESNAEVIIISNEVGSGIVPENKIAREFRDIAGIANQKLAEFANGVYLVVSGIPIKIKG